MQPGIVALRGALIAAWEEELRAVRQDSFDVGRGREALVFIQRFYDLISSLRLPIQRSWGPGGHVHVVDSQEVGGPGPRVSQSRIRLRNHGDEVLVELFTYADGSSRANPSAGLDGSGHDELELRLSIEQLQRYVEPQPDLENFLRIVQLAVDSDQEELRVSSSAIASMFGLDELALTRLGCLVASAPDVCRDGSFAADYSSWSFLPSYNVHFFRRVHTI